MFLENAMTPCFKNCGLEISRICTIAFHRLANLLVAQEYVKVSKQNHVAFQMEIFCIRISKTNMGKEKKTLLVNVRLCFTERIFFENLFHHFHHKNRSLQPNLPITRSHCYPVVRRRTDVETTQCVYGVGPVIFTLFYKQHFYKQRQAKVGKN